MDMLRFSDRFQAVLSLFSPQIGWIITVVKWVGMLRFIHRATRREMFELTQWRRTLEIIKNLLNVLAINLCINVADTMEDLMQGTQVISELEAILNILSPSEAVTMH